MALLGWSAPAWHLQARDRWLGWSPEQRRQRRHFLAQNSRFLILGDRHQFPNLATRSLARCCARLSDDWHEHHDHPLVAVESFVDGDADHPGLLVAGPTVKAIDELVADKNIRAVVVRINSPGGSVTASESVRRALEKLAAKKPVTISMGDLAASGGYWITCLGRPIYAEPGTITGSIGVFALKLSFGSLLKKVGVKVESVTLDESAGAMSLDRGWTPGEQEKMQGFVDDVYEKFLGRVASSRKMKTEAVAPIAGGRVWSGAQAAKLGLVDHLGGLDAAIAAAAEEAKLDPGFEVIHRPRHKSVFETIDLFGESSDEIRALLSPAAKDYLRRAGFDLSVPLNLLHQSLSGQPVRVWLLAPTEFGVR